MPAVPTHFSSRRARLSLSATDGMDACTCRTLPSMSARTSLNFELDQTVTIAVKPP